MIFIRWSAPQRVLPTAEVHEGFAARRDEILFFSFTTDRMTVEPHTGEFSVKFVTRGEECYRFGSRVAKVRPGQVLVVNAGEDYSSRIDQARTTSASFFLPPSALHSAVAALTHAERTLLDGNRSIDESFVVPTVPFRAGSTLAPAVDRLVSALATVRAPSLDLLEELVMEAAQAAVQEVAGLVPADVATRYARRSTCDELLSRVLRARDLIHDTAGRVSLDRMADEACLSRFHFLRVFRDFVGVTPARYARAVRMEPGRTRLEGGARAKAAARRAGYASSSTFLRGLRRAGLPDSAQPTRRR